MILSKKAYFTSAVPKTDVSLQSWFDSYASKLEAEGREGTRISYKTTINSLHSFRPHLKLTDITKEFLEAYEANMLLQGKSRSTIGIYLRQLRAIINQAIAKGDLKQEHYPFKTFEIPGGRNVKKALNDEQLQLLLTHNPSEESQRKALDFWILSYLCNGMNFTDIIHLTAENLNGNFLYFIRRKTMRTRKKDLRPIKVPLHPRAKEIINRWRNRDLDSYFVFPILQPGLTPKAIKNRTQRFIKSVNQAMDDIRNELKIEQKCTTYACRHSFSSRLMRKGASTQFIKESLGHSSAAVTENYLGDFEDSVKTEFANLLTEF